MTPMSTKRGKITIDESRCKGCEYCIIYCPKKCITLSENINVRGVRYAEFTNPDACIACNICARVCPDVCIEVFERKGSPLYQKMEDTIGRLIDSGLERLGLTGQTEKEPQAKPQKKKE
jgi:2-oxoglutarate ferredoxin oxidoreductase subunit delta